jgi:hypothetical protein
MSNHKRPSNSPLNPSDISVFLAGSIEMGKAIDWQTEVVKTLSDLENVEIYNPRREDWDSSWKQEEINPQFNHQVNWELNKLEKSDIIFLNFCSGTQSPISLMELGAFASSGKMIVVCPRDFWRRGNVQIMCTRNGIPLFDNLEDGIGALRTKIYERSYC